MALYEFPAAAAVAAPRQCLLDPLYAVFCIRLVEHLPHI